MIYCVTFKTESGELITLKYDSLLIRALVIISLSSYCDVIKEWIE